MKPKIIVAMSGALPQEEREAEGKGLVVLVSYDADFAGAHAPAIRRLGAISETDWHKWFDKALVFEDPALSPAFARGEALRLIPAISTRPRFVLVGRETALAFGLWGGQDDNLRWRWVTWSEHAEGIECDPRPQLFAVCDPTSPGDQREFWSALARACKNGRARTNA